MRHVLVTGTKGFIGSHLVRALLREKDIRLTLTDKFNRESDFLAYSKGFNNKPVSTYNLDVRNRGKVFDLFKKEKIDTCIHLAGKVDIEDSIKNPAHTMEVNVNGTLNILDACSFNRTKNFVFTSSASVYGNPIKLPISEDHVLNPLSPYGTSKVLGEQYVATYRISGKIQNAISLRIFNAYGKGQHISTDVITKFARRLFNGLPPIIYGNGMQKRDFISVIDIVNAIILSTKAMEEKSEILNSTQSCVFNIGTGISTSITELCKQMIRVSGLDLEPIYQEAENKGDIKDSCADITRAKNILQFIPKNKLEIDIENIVKHMDSITS
jgi:UDP-glucose 4-epimerase